MGEELQRLNMVEALPRLFSGRDPECIDKMVPKLQQALPGDGAEFHMIASSTFRTILEQKLVPPSVFTQTFLASIVACIDSRDPYSSKAWLETLLDLIELLPQNVVRNDILPVAVARGQLSQSIQSRVTSCQLLGRIAKTFDYPQLQKEVVPLVHSLCQDVSGEVRGSMCHQLPFIARGLPPDAVKPALLPLLVELAVDEEQYVRLAAVHAISELVTILPADVLTHTIVPLLRKLCDQAISKEDRVLCAISEKYGQLCIGLRDAFSESERTWFIAFFREMASLGIGKQPLFHDIKNVPEFVQEKEYAEILLQCRINCAYNFPGIAHFTGPSQFEDMIHSTFTALSCDHSCQVRRTIAGGIHEVFKILGPRCLVLKGELFTLLSDESRDVLQALVPNLSTLLDHLTKNDIITQSVTDSLTLELLRSLLKCEVSISHSNDWRLHSTMLGQLESYVKYLPSDLVFSNLPVVLFHRIQDSRALPCRLAAARLLLIVLRHTSKLEGQNEIRNRIFTDLCIHPSCHTRLLFVKMCGMALDIFSSFYIKEHFFLRLLSLASDPIPNVRLVLCGLLPRLKSMLKLPQDSNLLSALQDAIERLQNFHRPDKDVAAKLLSVCTEMESISLNGVSQDDAEDLTRYQEEQQIEMRSSVPETRRLVTVNMKTLGEGKRATLVSLRGPEVSRTELRQANRLSSGNDGNILSSVAVSSVGQLGGHLGNESRITASITSTTSESAPSYSVFSSLRKESEPSFNSITHVGNDCGPNYRALTQIKKDSIDNFSSFTPMKKEVPTVANKSDTGASPAASSTSSSSLLSSSYPALLEEEFYIDAGVPLPEQLTIAKMNSSSLMSSDPVSKIPSLRELLFQNSTLLAQVANRNSAMETTSSKSLSYAKSFNSSKVTEHTSSSGLQNNGPNKRFSRIFEENSSSDFRYSSLLARPSTSMSRKDNAGSSLLPKPTSVRGFHNDGDNVSSPSKESLQYNPKVLSIVSPRSQPARKESKIGGVNRRSMIYYSNQGNDVDRNNEKSLNTATLRNGKPEGMTVQVNHHHPSQEVFQGASSKSSCNTASKFSTKSPVGIQSSTSRDSFGPSKISSMKAHSLETPGRRYSSLDTPLSQNKEKELKNNIGMPSNKRYSLGDKSQVSNGSLDKKVSLSSIGVKGVRRSYNPGPRPHSCLILNQQNEKPSGANSRSMSQESLGMEHGKAGFSRNMKRVTPGFNRSENRQSRIPRGGTSCNSSPGNSRPSSPVHSSATYITVSTAPCSARASRSSSPTEGQSSRVSLASIKLHEPSRLPIRKYNHHL